MEEEKLIISKLDMLKKEVDFIKEHILDITLTQDDINSLQEAEKDLREGKTTSLEDMKKELGV
jgi:hypothetical protein